MGMSDPRSDHLMELGGDSRVTEHLAEVLIGRPRGEGILHVARRIAIVIVRNDPRDVGAFDVLIGGQAGHGEENVQSSQAKDGPVGEEDDHQACH